MGERGERAEILAAYKIILKVNPACLSSHYVVTCNILPLASFHIVFRLFIARDVGTLFSITARPVAVEQKFSFSLFVVARRLMPRNGCAAVDKKLGFNYAKPIERIMTQTGLS